MGSGECGVRNAEWGMRSMPREQGRYFDTTVAGSVGKEVGSNLSAGVP